MAIRVLRMLEYTYPDVETMEKDMGRWQIAANGNRIHGPNHSIKSATMPLETTDDQEETATDG